MNVVEKILLSVSKLELISTKFTRGSQGQSKGLIIGLLGGEWHELECLYSYRGALSGTPTLFWMGEHKTEGKYWGKTWTALMAVIYFQDQQKKSCGSTIQDRERERERVGGDIYSIKSPWQDLSTDELSVVQ